MKASYVIGVDSGTQSTKAVVVERSKGRVVGFASQTYDLIQGLPLGHQEQHPKIWIDALKYAVRKAIRNAKINSQNIVGMAVSGQQHGFVALDKKGNVIRPAKLWCDTSSALQCEEMTRKLGGTKRVLQLVGNRILPGFTASKILWLKQHEPKNYKQLASVLLPHDYLNFWLTGNRAMEFGDASGTALFDVKKRSWQHEVIRSIDPQLVEKLPPLQSSREPIGTLCPKAAVSLGLSSNVLVSAGGGDNMMAAIGTGNTKPGIVTVSLGTSGTIYAYSSKPMIDPLGEVASFCDSTDAWLPLVCTMNVTVATEMVRKCFGWSHDQFVKQVASVPPGSGGLLLFPYLQGERTPNIPEGTGVFFGVTCKTFDPAYLARAAMEGVTLGLNYGLNRLRKLGVRPLELRVTGGGSKNSVWRQIMADIFGCKVVGLQTTEGAAYGAALQAWWCYENAHGRPLKIQDLTDTFVHLDPKIFSWPSKKNQRTYTELQKLLDVAPENLKELFQSHRKFLTSKVCSEFVKQ